MKIYEWFNSHPDDHLRVILYTPAPDVEDEHDNLVCGGEGTSSVLFDSTTGNGDFPPDLIMKDIITINEGDDGVPELEIMPDDCYVTF